MSDLIPTTATPIDADQPAADGAPFVRVYVDKATGRAVVALDADAVDVLLDFVDQLGPGYDLTQNPGTYGLNDDYAGRIADVMGRITGPLNKLKGYI